MCGNQNGFGCRSCVRFYSKGRRLDEIVGAVELNWFVFSERDL